MKNLKYSLPSEALADLKLVYSEFRSFIEGQSQYTGIEIICDLKKVRSKLKFTMEDKPQYIVPRMLHDFKLVYSKIESILAELQMENLKYSEPSEVLADLKLIDSEFRSIMDGNSQYTVFDNICHLVKVGSKLKLTIEEEPQYLDPKILHDFKLIYSKIELILAESYQHIKYIDKNTQT